MLYLFILLFQAIREPINFEDATMDKPLALCRNSIVHVVAYGYSLCGYFGYNLPNYTAQCGGMDCSFEDFFSCYLA